MIYEDARPDDQMSAISSKASWNNVVLFPEQLAPTRRYAGALPDSTVVHTGGDTGRKFILFYFILFYFILFCF